MTKLTKLSIKKFRNVAPTTLEFRPGLNVLLGRNAAGKTTLLRLLSAALGHQEEALRDDALDVSYRASGASLDFEHTITRIRVSEPALTLDPDRPIGESLSSLQQTDSFVFEKDGVVGMKADVFPNRVVFESAGTPRTIENRTSSNTAASLFLALTRNTKDSASKELAQVFVSAQMSPGSIRQRRSCSRIASSDTPPRSMCSSSSRGP